MAMMLMGPEARAWEGKKTGVGEAGIGVGRIGVSVATTEVTTGKAASV